MSKNDFSQLLQSPLAETGNLALSVALIVFQTFFLKVEEVWVLF